MTSGGVTGALLFAVSASVLGVLQFGFNAGVINSPRGFIENFISDNYQASPSLLFSVIVSIFAIGGIIGCPLASWLQEKYGRKNALLLNAAFGVIGAAFMGFSKLAVSVEMLIIGRFLIGINCGFATTTSPTYVSEIAPVTLRGAIGACNQLAFATGMVGSQILGIDVILGSDDGWPWLLGLAAVPSALQCMMLPFAPESPRYLLLALRKERKAREALMKLRGTARFEDEINAMLVEDQAEKQEQKFSTWDLFKIKVLRTPLIIGVVVHLSQQLGGINAVLYYSTTIFQNAGLEIEMARLASIGIGGILLVMAVVSMPLMDRLGRRTLQLVGLAGMTLFSILMTVTFAYKENETMRIFTVIFTLLFVAFFGVGPSTLPWIVVPELFRQGARSSAVGVGISVNWLANFAVSLAFIPMNDALGDLIFVPFTGLLVLFFTFTYFKLPETKNKTIEDVTALFK